MYTIHTVGWMAEWLCSGLQSRLRRFDSGFSLQLFLNKFLTKNIKVKELIVEPGKSMSFQRHFKRNEIWLVSDGECEVRSSKENFPQEIEKNMLSKFDYFIVPLGKWHQIINPTKNSTHIIEIQYGDQCEEDDIERV